MSDRLSRILSPLLPEAFFESFRSRTYLHVSRNTEGFYDGVLSVGDLDACLQSELLAAAAIDVVKGGERPRVEEWTRRWSVDRGSTSPGHLSATVALPAQLFRLYMEGSTLILNSSDLTIPPLIQACRELMSELKLRVWANIYITPPGTQGYPRHSDRHDVLILQISGRKNWSLYPCQDEKPFELELCPGDLLYMPRGLAHQARCSEHGSIHVTVGLQPIYGFHLVEELAAAARDSPLFQQPVWPDFAGDAAGHPAGNVAGQVLNSEFAARLQTLLAEAPPSTLFDRRFRDFVDKQHTGWPGRFSDVLRLREMSGDTVLCARAAIVREIEDCGDSITVRFAAVRTTVPKFLRACLDRVLDNTPFTIHEIPGLMTVDGKVEFVKPFVANGLLSIVRL